jgi:hypothetical protein
MPKDDNDNHSATDATGGSYEPDDVYKGIFHSSPRLREHFQESSTMHQLGANARKLWAQKELHSAYLVVEQKDRELKGAERGYQFGSTRHAYELQLLFLEENSRKRLAMAQAEQELL